MSTVRRLLWHVAVVLTLAVPVCGSAILANQQAETWAEEFESLNAALSSKSPPGGLHKAYGPMRGHAANEHALIWDTDRIPVDIVLRRTGALLSAIRRLPGARVTASLDARLESLRTKVNRAGLGKTMAGSALSKALFVEACALRREIALSNPLLDFDKLLFSRQMTEVHGPLQTNNFGYKFVDGGSIYVASGFKTGKMEYTDIIKGAVVKNGRIAGKRLDEFPTGAFNSPSLSFDARTVYFAWRQQPFRSTVKGEVTADSASKWSEETSFHLFSIGIDGSNLRQLTSGRFDDYHPCEFPNGRIVFVSSRRNTTVRCNGAANQQPGGVLYSIKLDGSDLIQLSYHEITELNPWVDNDSKIVYTRWDYIDRDFSAAHHIWTCNPDGTDPRAPHGNYPYPWDVFKARDWQDGRSDRPWAEYMIKPIPGVNGKYVAIAGAHHIGDPVGVPVLIDTRIPDDNKMSQVKNVTPAHCIPDEGCGYAGSAVESANCTKGLYRDAWPLSEDFMIILNGTKTVVLLDKFGNRETMFTWVCPAGTANCNPGQVRYVMPVKERQIPRARATGTWQGERYGAKDHYRATMSVMNVYESDVPFPSGTKIKELRIFQILGKPWSSPYQNRPAPGYGSGGICRMALGTVPVEEDGSAYFEAPVGIEIYFQALDERGMAVQSMRSGTYVHPGEHLTCTGCHEDKWKAQPSVPSIPRALRRAPSKLKPEPDGSMPWNFHRLVKPVFNGKCLPCHKSSGKGITNFGFSSLEDYAFYFHGAEYCHGLEVDHGGYRTLPGKFGALQSRMGKALLSATHQGAIAKETLTQDDFRRVTLWLDGNSHELGSYDPNPAVVAKQRAGEVVWPNLDVDPANPTAVESNRPLPGTIVPSFRHSGLLPRDGAFGISAKRGVVRVQSFNAEPLHVSVYNLTGRQVARNTQQSFSDGSRVQRLQGTGVYIVRAVAGAARVKRAVASID